MSEWKESIPLFDSDGDNTAQAAKTTPGRVHSLQVYNGSDANAFIQFFDTAVADVTVGTTTPIQSYFVPVGGAYTSEYPFAWKFKTAITYACTTTATGNTDPSTGLTVNLLYS